MSALRLLVDPPAIPAPVGARLVLGVDIHARGRAGRPRLQATERRTRLSQSRRRTYLRYLHRQRAAALARYHANKGRSS